MISPFAKISLSRRGAYYTEIGLKPAEQGCLKFFEIFFCHNGGKSFVACKTYKGEPLRSILLTVILFSTLHAWMMEDGIAACKKDNAEACAVVGMAYDSGVFRSYRDTGNELFGESIKRKRNRSKAKHYLHKACLLGDSRSCAYLAGYYVLGIAGKRDIAQGQKYLSKACEGRIMDGCVQLGNLHMDLHKPSEAIVYYKKACEHYHGEGCYRVGIDSMNGYSMLRDQKKALEYFIKSCNNRYGKGCTEAGMFIYKGKGITKSPANALEHLKYFEEGCKYGDSHGCDNMGFAYYHGKGVPRDLNRSLSYYEKGCKMGSKVSCKRSEFVKGKI
jgi:hypothetical protein